MDDRGGSVDDWGVSWINPSVSRVLGVFLPMARSCFKTYFLKVVGCAHGPSYDFRAVLAWCLYGYCMVFCMVVGWFLQSFCMVVAFSYFKQMRNECNICCESQALVSEPGKNGLRI